MKLIRDGANARVRSPRPPERVGAKALLEKKHMEMRPKMSARRRRHNPWHTGQPLRSNSLSILLVLALLDLLGIIVVT